MMERLQRQVSALLESRAEAEADVRANDELGARVRSLLAEKLAGNASAARDALERFDAYMNELDRVLRLHHRVSAQLERVNGSLNALREDASPAERVRSLYSLNLRYASCCSRNNDRRVAVYTSQCTRLRVHPILIPLFSRFIFSVHLE